MCSQGGDSALCGPWKLRENGMVGLRVQMRAWWRASSQRDMGACASTRDRVRGESSRKEDVRGGSCDPRATSRGGLRGEQLWAKKGASQVRD